MKKHLAADYFAGINARWEPEFTWGYTGPDAASSAERTEKLHQFSAVEAERALTLVLGEMLGLKLDRDIFRTQLPVEQSAGAVVNLTTVPEEQPPDCRVFKAELCCRDIARDRGKMLLSKLCARLPLPAWLTIKSAYMLSALTLADLRLNSPREAMLTRNTYHHRQVWNLQVDLTAVFVVTPPRGVAENTLTEI